MSQTQSDDEVVGLDPELYPDVPAFPTQDMADADVESTEFGYSTRGPDDWVIGGPLGVEMVGSKRPGRWFESWSEAEAWAKAFYGPRFKGRKPAEPGDTRQWAFVVKGPRG